MIHVLATVAIIITLVMGVIDIRKWVRGGFWLPRYVHIIAALAALLGVGLGWLNYASGAGTATGAVVLVIILPALVYLAFVFYGGATAAMRRRPAPTQDDPDQET